MQEILLPDVAASRVTRHCNEALGAIEADRAMAECSEGLEISPRPAAEIQDRKRGLDFYMAQQRRDVLRDVVVVRAVAEIFRVRVVVLQRGGTDFIEVAGGRVPCRKYISGHSPRDYVVAPVSSAVVGCMSNRMNNAIRMHNRFLLGFRGTRTVSGERLEMGRSWPIVLRLTRAFHKQQHATRPTRASRISKERTLSGAPNYAS